MISVVVCTYNRADHLRKMLGSFFAQTCLDEVPYEILVIDNNSTDDTPAVVQEFERFNTVRYVHEERQGLCCARNRGVREARGDIIALLDDDVLVSAEWLANLRTCFEETGADVVGGRAYLAGDHELPDWIGPYFRRMLGEVELGPQRRQLAVGGELFGLNLAFRRRVFDDTGFFDESLDRRGNLMLGGGDTAKVRQVLARGGKVYYEPQAHVGHMYAPQRVDWRRFQQQAFWIGRSFALFRRESIGGRPPMNVARALLVLTAGPLLWLWKWVRGAGLYQRRLVVMRMRVAEGFLRGRLRRGDT